MAHPCQRPAIFRYFSLLLTIRVAVQNSQAQENQISSGDQFKKLYVLDAGNERKKPQVLVVNLSNGKVIRKYRAGYQPDMVLSPDGKQLYIASSFENAAAALESALEIYDTGSGLLIGHVSNPEALQHTVPVYGTSMAMSPSGKHIYMEKYYWTPGTPGPSGCYTAVFDTQSRQFLINISVSNCGHVEEQTVILKDMIRLFESIQQQWPQRGK